MLIKNGYLISLDDDVGDIQGCDILIEGGRIARIGRGLAEEELEVLDASGMIILPGLVDAHLHTWQTGIRGIAGDWTLFDYGRGMHAGLARVFGPEDIYIANLVGALNQLNAGITTLFDWCHNNPTPEHSNRAIDGLRESGIRAVFGHGTPKPKLDSGGVPTEELLHPRDEVRRIHQERIGDSRRLGMALCIRGPDLASIDACRHDIDLAREYGLKASMHVGGRMPFNVKTPGGIRMLAESGHLGPHINVVHGNKLTDADIAVLAEAGASFTVTPEVEMQMGHGIPITGRVRRYGAEPSVGIDVESNIGSNLLGAARFALQVERGLANRAVNDAGEEVSEIAIPSRQALQWATIEGARALGMEDEIGSVTVGKWADLILIRGDDLNLFPAHCPAESIVFHAEVANIDTVLVAGEYRKRNGRLVYDDLSEKKKLLARSGCRILEETGIAATTLT